MIAMSPYGYYLDYLIIWALYLSLVIHTYSFFKIFPRKKKPRTGLVLGNGLVLACLLGTIGLVWESQLRFVSVETEALGMSLPSRRWFALHTELNSLGCRDKEWSRDKRNRHRVAFVGDSFAYGWGVEDTDHRFTGLLQAKFDAVRPGAVEVLTVAKPGWGTANQIQPVRDLVTSFGVDEVVLCYLPNDMETAIDIDPSFDPTRPPESTWINPDFSPLMYHLHARLAIPRAPTVAGYFDWLAEGFERKESWRRHTQALTYLRDICQENGATFKVVLLPFLMPTRSEFDLAGIHAKVKAFLQSIDVPVLDLLPRIQGRDHSELVVNSADPHPNEAAHAIFADAIWDAYFRRP
ncbi:MAG: SGNH/GDSL hydrolase family protein [Planctomycetota bacterium]|jgi:lysophospholipase L1-like esterase